MIDGDSKREKGEGKRKIEIKKDQKECESGGKRGVTCSWMTSVKTCPGFKTLNGVSFRMS